jgi:hypothetical protein
MLVIAMTGVTGLNARHITAGTMKVFVVRFGEAL